MATVFDINNFAIDHVIRGVMTSISDGSYMWSINQITDPSLNVTSETEEVVDGLGTPIVTFNRGKQAEFSAANSLFDLGLYAAQQGRDKEVAGVNVETIVSPAFETIDITADKIANGVSLNHIPNAQIKEIFLLNGDDTLGKKFNLAKDDADASEELFVHTEGSQIITLPTSVEAGNQIFVMYEYNSERAVAVTGTAVDFPKAGKFVMEVLGTDICDPTTLIHAYVVFPNAKLLADVDISFTTDGNHPSKWAA